MYLFMRAGRLAPGQMQDGLEWAVEITEKVNQITSLDVGLWTPMLSEGIGRLSWGASVEHLAELEEADAKLMADPTYLDLVQRGAKLTAGGFDDQTLQFVHNPGADHHTSHVAVVRAQLANGQFAKGIEVGVAIADRATKLSGTPTSFLMAITGDYGGCAWITAAPSLGELEAAEQATSGNPEFLSYLDAEASPCYLPGSARQSIWRRII